MIQASSAAKIAAATRTTIIAVIPVSCQLHGPFRFYCFPQFRDREPCLTQSASLFPFPAAVCGSCAGVPHFDLRKCRSVRAVRKSPNPYRGLPNYRRNLRAVFLTSAGGIFCGSQIAHCATSTKDLQWRSGPGFSTILRALFSIQTFIISLIFVLSAGAVASRPSTVATAFPAQSGER
jgi:hypothetical protein